MLAKHITLFGLLGAVTAVAVPKAGLNHTSSNGSVSPMAKVAGGSFDCNNRPFGLNKADCEYMASINMAGTGINARSTAKGSQTGTASGIWIGKDGPNQFTFRNAGAGPAMTVIVWDFPAGDFEASFLNVRQPKISYSLPKVGDTVTISLANGISGGFASLVTGRTRLSNFGQLDNTWGEFTTGSWATVDVSRLVNTRGDPMNIKVQGSGCVTDMDTCVFTCKNQALTFCGQSGEYNLTNCANGSQPGATLGTNDGTNPEGGCQGWSNGGKLDIGLGAN